ncbi:2OG-FeII_Oxy domain-containing protein/DIOX_N domain-containing protein [Cephalotus follicularis]|uniref:2OG-FeII_Oxy domain-containing protein/DIOX_N domain-containing protein n=1 Tax=Cephalotus follicularis TaxID=3775 RepID=A0A1Q3C1G5_CEPFO|nr:2OG-FeII_Oxy domain-containing protein/DIOX_N domain-containing protein [Cephalotus follicularis]
MDLRSATMRGVQSLAEAGIAHVPAQYIQPPQTRIGFSLVKHNNIDIPTIDLDPSQSKQLVREAIGSACRDWGAFHVINHGVPIPLLDEMRSAGLSFFERCSTQDKLCYACDPNLAATEGYGSKMLQSTDTAVLDWRDYFDHHTLPLARRNPSRWPHFPPSYRHVVSEYSDHMKLLADKLLAIISESLGLPSYVIGDAVGEFYQNITVSYYPPCPQPDITLGLQSHSDMGAITLLIQDHVEGLQVFKDGQWITVLPSPHAILVILADQTEIITNGKYKSAQHRAITNASRARLSVATFHDPAKTAKISPARELVNESSPARYREVIYGDYVTSWYTKGPEGKQNMDALLLKC